MGKLYQCVHRWGTSNTMSFLNDTESDFHFIISELWWLRITFLNDIFEKLNHLNLSLQGENENIITMTCKLKSFEEKLNFWITKAHNSELDMFAGINSLARKIEILPEIQRTLKNLDDLFGKYFPSLDTKKYEWVINPFTSYNLY